MIHRGISKRQAYRALGVSRSRLAYIPKRPEKIKALIEPIKLLGETRLRFGYRRIGVMLAQQKEDPINVKRVYRIWRMLNLQLPKSRRQRSDPISPVSIRANLVRSYDSVATKRRTKSTRSLRR